MRYTYSMKKHLPAIAAITFWAAPFVALAATDQNLESVIKVIAGYLDLALKLLMGFAVLMFVWNVVRYFIFKADETNRGQAAQYVMWSLVGFFVILSIWGLVNILLATFNLGGNSSGSMLTNLSSVFPK